MEASFAAYTSVPVRYTLFICEDWPMNQLRRFNLILCLAIFAAVAAGCGTNNSKTTKVDSSAPVLFKVIDQNGRQTDFSISALKALPLITATINNKVQGGPSLVSVLKKAGISEFEKVTVHGKDGTECTLTFKQCDKKSILDFTNRGTVKLATKYINMDKWAKDITKITVK